MKITVLLLALVCLIGAPLAGVHLSGGSAGDFMEFPPASLAVTIDHAPFSRTVFFILLILTVMVISPFIIRVITYNEQAPEQVRTRSVFPLWGWVGLVILATGWILAWTRFPWFSQMQPHTFTIPWTGYIIVVNALLYKRTGRSLPTHEPFYFVSLFVSSALFWWYFEFLNQFTQNWYYVNTETLGRFEFFIYATLPFATVLPAVISTFRLMETFPGISRGLDRYTAVPVSHKRTFAIFGGFVATVALAATPILPGHLFHMLWLAPLVIIAAAMVIAGVPTFLSSITRGSWRSVWLLALSGLICGFFWEMWNYFSYTRWEYAVPFVQRFEIFEMPVLGYAGYLPFGLQCGLMALLVKHMLNPSTRWVKP